jgi:hypothetical protein
MIKNILTASLACALAFISHATDLDAIRNMYTGSPMVLPAGTIITVTVISDRANNNTHQQNAIVQDLTGGICLRADSAHTLNMNDSIMLDVSGDSLSEFNGLLQITHVDLSSATFLGNGNPDPITTSISDILNNMSSDQTWESRLVRITNATITNSATGIYAGNDTITDPSGNMILYTRAQATFANNALPQGDVIVIGFVTVFGIPEISIRNLDDVELNPTVPEFEWAGKIKLYPNPAIDFFTLEFEQGTINAEVSLLDMTGKQILSLENVTPTNRLFVSNLERGIYFVRIREGEFFAVKKVSVVD